MVLLLDDGRPKALLLAALVGLSLLSGSALGATTTILDVIANQTDSSSFADAVRKAGLESELQSTAEPLTLFAPTNQAMSLLGDEYLARLFTPPLSVHLNLFVLSHLSSGVARLSDELVSGLQLPMRGWETISFERVGSTVSILDSEGVAAARVVTGEESIADNGVVHRIDGVLRPSWMKQTVLDLAQDPYGTTVEYFGRAGMAEMLLNNSVTVFAPTNLAWFNMGEWELNELVNDVPRLKRLMERHVLPSVYVEDRFENGRSYETLAEGVTVTITKTESGTFMVDESTIDLRDFLSAQSVTHGIDTVLEESSFPMSVTTSGIFGLSLVCAALLILL